MCAANQVNSKTLMTPPSNRMVKQSKIAQLEINFLKSEAVIFNQIKAAVT